MCENTRDVFGFLPSKVLTKMFIHLPKTVFPSLKFTD